MTSPALPYRFPAPPEAERAARCTSQACGACGASALASCVALCCCPCAVVSCLTLALVKAPYMAGRRCVVKLARSRLRKARRVRDVDDDELLQGELIKAAAVAAALPPFIKEWGELARDAAVGGAEGRARVMSSSRSDPAEMVWVEMYQLGLWGFGRLSLSPPTASGGGDFEKDGGEAASL